MADITTPEVATTEAPAAPAVSEIKPMISGMPDGTGLGLTNPVVTPVEKSQPAVAPTGMPEASTQPTQTAPAEVKKKPWWHIW